MTKATVRTGHWGKPPMAGLEQFPEYVQRQVADLLADDDTDWTAFMFQDRYWFVAKLWQTPHDFAIVVCEVLWESGLQEADDYV